MKNKTFYYSIPALLIGITLVIIFFITQTQDQEMLVEPQKISDSFDTNASIVTETITHSHDGGSEHSHSTDHRHIDTQTGLVIDLDLSDQGGYKTAVVTIDGQEYFLDIADTNKLRVQGLSNRKMLREGGGMIFTFDQPGQHGIWMKDMNFAIDIVWVNKDATVVHAETNVSPDTYPTVFTPPAPSDYVIELAANTWTPSSSISW